MNIMREIKETNQARGQTPFLLDSLSVPVIAPEETQFGRYRPHFRSAQGRQGYERALAAAVTAGRLDAFFQLFVKIAFHFSSSSTRLRSACICSRVRPLTSAVEASRGKHRASNSRMIEEIIQVTTHMLAHINSPASPYVD